MSESGENFPAPMQQKTNAERADQRGIHPFAAEDAPVGEKQRVYQRQRPDHPVPAERVGEAALQRQQHRAGHAAAGTIDARQPLKGAAHLKDEHQRDPNDQPCGDQQLFLPPDAAHGDSPLPVNIVADGARDMLACGII